MPSLQFQEGDIAYLKTVEGARQTNHPCVVVKRLPGNRYLITTVSAYGCQHFDNRAPWKRPGQSPNHPYRVRQWSFRAFRGSEKPLLAGSKRPEHNRPHLELLAGQSWPKPQASWLCVDDAHEVDAGALWYFTKARDPVTGRVTPLKMTPESLRDLQGHIGQVPKHRINSTRWGLVPSHPAKPSPGGWTPSTTPAKSARGGLAPWSQVASKCVPSLSRMGPR